MPIGKILSTTDIAASGLSAERMRMEVAANNIANAHSTRTAEGGPYRRQQVQFSSAMEAALGGNANQVNQSLRGVKVEAVVDDPTPGQRIYNPGHPDADPEGFVQMPNVQMPMEMVDLMTASRAYDANLKSLTLFREMAEQALSLMSRR